MMSQLCNKDRALKFWIFQAFHIPQAQTVPGIICMQHTSTKTLASNLPLHQINIYFKQREEKWQSQVDLKELLQGSAINKAREQKQETKSKHHYCPSVSVIKWVFHSKPCTKANYHLFIAVKLINKYSSPASKMLQWFNGQMWARGCARTKNWHKTAVVLLTVKSSLEQLPPPTKLLPLQNHIILNTIFCLFHSVFTPCFRKWDLKAPTCWEYFECRGKKKKKSKAPPGQEGNSKCCA